jgi:peptide/nickel transport system permease protein
MTTLSTREQAVPATGTALAPLPGAAVRAPRTRRRAPARVLPVLVAGLLVLAAVAPQALTPHDPYAVDPAHAFTGPSLQHWFGTDQSGRDVLTRVVYGARQSLLTGALATAVGVGSGLVLGLLAGLGGRWADAVVSRGLEVLFAFPGLVLALLFIAVFGTGVLTSAIAVGIGTAPGYARMFRGQALVVSSAGYVEAARALGHPARRILTHTVLPNVVRPLLVLATLGLGQSVVWAASLSFLGLGAQPPAAEWGAMLADSRDYVSVAWWLPAFPGLLITLTALVSTVVGRQMRAGADARSPR